MSIRPRASAFLFLLLCTAHGTAAEPARRPGAHPAQLQQDSIAGYRYLTFVTGTAKPGERLPMIVGLHYSGASPETIVGDFAGIDFPARIILPQGRYPRRAAHSWFPSDYGALEAAAQQRVTFDILNEVSAFIDSASNTYPTREKPVVVGTSYGGDLSFLLAIHHPEQVLAAFPVAARFLPAWMPETGRCEPGCPLVFVMHGDEDRTVPMEPTRHSADRLAGMGLRVEFHSYAGAAHEFSDGMKADFTAAARRILAKRAP
ncbi:MAG TPA: dienelactone hydrolase family protein [Gemmatimonadaceae bacterium]|nr:dienelactone hydrolase family protein [Gemmatimonadaceae bacterium]